MWGPPPGGGPHTVVSYTHSGGGREHRVGGRARRYGTDRTARARTHPVTHGRAAGDGGRARRADPPPSALALSRPARPDP
ncbi:hypothetical protein Sgou_11790 [Streptomyces gougerotii]|uniref:Uncharacterized protein n=2 Tax=Streptomyces diastaticus group TaxID=2849069 RepID=A0A8H9HJL9_9ACTN|nr:hypothetical protein Srut_27510 [Streptomyces rutgersensis]GFH71490.1 hypothetical protein Sdia_22580 [Streptomyces diastaticus subsp. diastaticus]GFH76509.1 hypothetical protein Sgou_11790 [Streptomyces gougerotii]GGU12691.1 hypothetical protein GCM10015534_14140 [Streptomyces diastaticus subsp. diastaticus]GGU60313.1 hypothetical protein GCM10010227_12200 [Streptomyces gougerotii]